MLLSYAFILIMLAIGIGPMLWEISKGRFDFFNLKNPFIMYYILQLGISGFLSLQLGSTPVVGLDPALFAAAYFKAIVLSTAGLFFFQAGYYTQTSQALKLPRLLRLKWREPNISLTIALFYASGILSFFLLLKINGGLSSFLDQRESWRAGGLEGQGFLIFPATFIMNLSVIIYFIRKSYCDYRSRFWYVKAFLLFLGGLVPAFLMGFRSALALPVIQLMLVVNYTCKKISLSKLSISFGLISLAFIFYGIVREIPKGFSLNLAAISETIAKKPELLYSIISRSKGIEVVASVIYQLDQTGDFDYGWRSVLEAVTICIPGRVWKNKPKPSGVRFTTYFFGNDLTRAMGGNRDTWGGVSPTVVGELYWHFSWFGVLAGLYLLGRIAKIAYCTMRKNAFNPSILTLYAVLYTSFAMFAEAVQGYLNGLVMASVVMLCTFAIFSISFLPSALSHRSA